MDQRSDKEITDKKQRDQMLKLVSKGFYNELTNYGVRKHEIVLRMALFKSLWLQIFSRSA